MTQNVNRYRQTIGELQREVDVLSQENKGYAAEDRRLRDDLDVLQSQTPGSPRANKELRSLNKERQALLQQLEANDENLVRLTISEGSLKKDLQTQRINSNERHQRIGGLKNQLNEAQGELALASNELKTASHLLTAAQQDVDDQTTLLQISSAELATAEARLAEAQLGSDTAQVDVDTQAAMVDALRDQGVSDAASTGDAVGEAISSTGAPVLEDIPSTGDVDGDVVTGATVGALDPLAAVDNVPTAPQFKPRSFQLIADDITRVYHSLTGQSVVVTLDGAHTVMAGTDGNITKDAKTAIRGLAKEMGAALSAQLKDADKDQVIDNLVDVLQPMLAGDQVSDTSVFAILDIIQPEFDSLDIHAQIEMLMGNQESLSHLVFKKLLARSGTNQTVQDSLLRYAKQNPSFMNDISQSSSLLTPASKDHLTLPEYRRQSDAMALSQAKAEIKAALKNESSVSPGDLIQDMKTILRSEKASLQRRGVTGSNDKDTAISNRLRAVDDIIRLVENFQLGSDDLQLPSGDVGPDANVKHLMGVVLGRPEFSETPLLSSVFGDIDKPLLETLATSIVSDIDSDLTTSQASMLSHMAPSFFDEVMTAAGGSKQHVLNKIKDQRPSLPLDAQARLSVMMVGHDNGAAFNALPSDPILTSHLMDMVAAEL